MPTQTVKEYDLTRPKGFDRNDVRMLRNQFGAFARQASLELTTLLHQNCSVVLTGDIESPWDELKEMMDRRPYLASFSLAPLVGTAVFTLPRDTAVRMLDFRLGGGYFSPFQGHDQLTDCDYGVIATVTNGLIESLAFTLGRGRKLTPIVTRQDTDPQFFEVASHTDMFFVACFNLTLGEDPLVEMFIGVPFGLVHQIIESMHTAAAIALTEEVAISQKTVLTVPLVVDLELPPIELTPAAVAELAVGDVIRLKHPLSRPLELKADGVTVARARLGRSGTRQVCLVTEEENDER